MSELEKKCRDWKEGEKKLYEARPSALKSMVAPDRQTPSTRTPNYAAVEFFSWIYQSTASSTEGPIRMLMKKRPLSVPTGKASCVPLWRFIESSGEEGATYTCILCKITMEGPPDSALEAHFKRQHRLLWEDILK